MTRRTILKGPLHMEQDITKSEGVWHPSEEPADGDGAVLDGTDTMLATYWWGTGVLPSYQTRDGRRVMSVVGNYTPMGISPLANSKSAWRFGSYSLFTAYLHHVDLYTHMAEATQAMYGGIGLDFTESPPVIAERYSRSMDEITGIRTFANNVSIDATGWTSDWYRFGVMLHRDRSFSICAGPESAEVEWVKTSEENYYPSLCRNHFAATLTVDCTQYADAVLDLYEIAWGLE